MTTIKATCPACGEVGLTPPEVELWVDPAELEASYYAFMCPSCLVEVRKPADDRVVRLLTTGGVAVRHMGAVAVREPRFPGPRLVHDDLLDFHTLLAGEDWFGDLVALVRRDAAARTGQRRRRLGRAA